MCVVEDTTLSFLLPSSHSKCMGLSNFQCCGEDWDSSFYGSLHSQRYLGKVMQQIHTSISSQLHRGCQQICTLTLFNWDAAVLGCSLASPNKTPFLHCGPYLQGSHQASDASLSICLRFCYRHSSWMLQGLLHRVHQQQYWSFSV